MPRKRDIKNWLKNHAFVIASVGVVVTYLSSRLFNILGIPMFNDEAIYLRWAYLIKDDWHNIFVSLVDGKQPSFIWAESIMLHIFENPLLAGRIVSVFTGLVTMVGFYFITKEVFNNKRTALLSSLLYVFYPYSLLYDRMALYDSMLSMLAIWSLYFEVLLVRRRQVTLAIICASVIGGGLLTKSGALFFIYLLPFSLLLFDFKTKHWPKELLRWFGLVLIVVLGAVAIQSVMRVSPNFRYIASKNHEFTLSFGEWIKQPWSYFSINFRVLWGFVIGYSTLPFLVLAAGSFIDKKFIREKLLLLAWSVLPFIAFACFARLLYPRYILFMLMPLIPLAAYTVAFVLKKIKPTWVAIIIVTLALVPMIWKDYFIITNFSKAPVPQLDKYAYIEGFFSGVGVEEAVSFIQEKSKDQKIYVGVHGTFGIMPYSLQNYLHDNPNVEIQEFGGIGPEPPSQIVDATKRLPVYFIFRAPCSTCPAIGLPPAGWPTEEIFRIKRIEENSYFTLVKIVPN